MEYKQALKIFIDDMNYLEDDDVEGIIFYGSFQTGTYNKYSDIDLMVIFSDDSNRNQIKGYKKVSEIDVEYFERTLSKVYERVNLDYIKCEDSLLSIIGYGKIIFDRNGKIKELVKYVKDKYSKPLPVYTKNDALYQIISIKKLIDGLEDLNKQNDPYFESLYFLIVEKIRDFYHKLNGYSNLSQKKIYRIYTDKVIQKAQHKKLPEKEFIELFLNAIEVGTSNKEKINRLYKLFDYTTQNYDIDFDNVRIDLGEKRY